MAHTLLSFGTGAFGRLGFPGSDDQIEPKPLPLNGRDITCVAAGLYHSAVVTSDHSVCVFGTNATDCLGSEDSKNFFFEPNKYLSPRLQIVQVAVGGDLIGAHTLAVSKHGRLYAMGQTSACGIHASDESTIKTPSLVTEFVKQDLGNVSGKEIISPERVVFAAAGGSCSAVITTEGHLYTFGITASGRLGHERKSIGNTVQIRPKRVDALLFDSVLTVSVGGSHMVCVTQRGLLFAWGDNAKGQVGTGDLNDRYIPVRIHHPKRAAWAPVIAASEGQSLAVDVHGKLYAWGLGSVTKDRTERERALCVSLQVKNPELDFASPSQIKALADHRVERVGAGVRHSVAITTGGLVFVWGSKFQVGINACMQFSTPRLLFPQAGSVLGLAAGSYHTLLLRNTEFASTAFKGLLDKAILPLPTASVDAYLKCAGDKKLWINTAALRARVTSSAFSCFWQPQLTMLSREWEEEPLAKIAEYFKLDAGIDPEWLKVAGEYARLSSVIDEWVAESVQDKKEIATVPEIPSDCLFNSLPQPLALQFYSLVLQDELAWDAPPDGSVESEAVVHRLTKLAICSQLERGVALLQQRLKRIQKEEEIMSRMQIPKSNLKQSIDNLLFKAQNAASSFVPGFVYFHCGPPKMRQMHSDVVAIHAFVAESCCPQLFIPAGESEQDRSPARRRNAWTVRVEDEAVYHVECPTAAVDVMRELFTFFYLNKFQEAENALEEDFEFDDENNFVFWTAVASAAADLGSDAAQAAAMDKLVSRMTEKNCLRIASIATKSIKKCNQVKEAALSVAEDFLTLQVERSAEFKKRSLGWTQKQDISSLVDAVLSGEPPAADPALQDAVRDRVVEKVYNRVKLERKLKQEMENIQGLNSDIVECETKKILNLKAKISLWIKSLTVSVRGGPSLLSAGRDLAIVVAVSAYFSAASGGILAGIETSSRIVLVSVNLACLSVFVFILLKHFKPYI